MPKISLGTYLPGHALSHLKTVAFKAHLDLIHIDYKCGAHYFISTLSVATSGRLFCRIKADSHTACRAHAIPLPCRPAKGLDCVFPIWFTQCGRVWFTLAMPCPCHAPTKPFFSRPRHSTSVERGPVGYLPAFGFCRLSSGVSRRLLSEAYQSHSQVASVKPNNICHGQGKEW
jgi:hypothetical protein